ncbi:MAG: type II toxin-antitoxin system Phd/YefM family antitoxin [Caldilineaceae bacterium]
MAVIIASSQVQQKFGTVFDQVTQNEDVIIERYGAPRIAMINYTRYERLLRAEQELLQQRLQQASAAVARRAVHLTEAEIDDLIEEARNESQPEAVTL